MNGLQSLLAKRVDAAPAGPAAIDLDEATLFGLWTETLLYGVFLMLFIATMWALIWRRSTERVNRVLLVTACLLMLLGTTHLGINVARTFATFFEHADNRIRYLANVADQLNMAQLGVYGTQAIISDLILLYRNYIVWGRNLWISALLFLPILASAISGYGALYKMNFISGGGVFVNELTQWITSFFCISLITNVLSTALLAYRIWSIQKQIGTNNVGSSTIKLIVESGAIFSTALILQIAFYAIKSNAQYIILVAFPPLNGIVFCMMIIRVALGVSNNGSNKYPNNTRPAPTSRGSPTPRPGNYPRPLVVNIEKVQTGDGPSTRDSARDSYDDLPYTGAKRV